MSDENQSESEQEQEIEEFEEEDATTEIELQPGEIIDTHVNIHELAEKVTVCMICKEDNLLHKVKINNCPNCKQYYCIHYASVVDPGQCVHCLHDVVMTDEYVKKSREVYSEKTDKVYIETQRARRIAFSGLDWLMATRKIATITNEELALAIEYHHTIFNEMISERERRRMEHFRRNAGKSSTIKFSTTQSSEVITTKKSRVIKVKGSASDEDINLQATLQILLKSGMSKEQIMALAGKKK